MIDTNIDEFLKEVEGFEDDIGYIIVETVKRTVIRTFAVLVRRSPVLTGFFQACLVCSLDIPWKRRKRVK